MSHALFLAAALLPQQPVGGHSLEILDLAPFAGARADEMPPFETLLPDMLHGQTVRHDLLHVADSSEMDESPSRYLELTRADDAGNGRLSWNADSARHLLLQGQTDLVAAAMRELVALRRIVARPIAIGVELRAADDGADPAIIAKADAAGDADRGAVLWRAAGTTPDGRTMVFDALRWMRYVRAANVEVAQKSSISNPALAIAGEGISLAVEAHTLVDSTDVVMFVQFACGQRRRCDVVGTGVPGQPNLDQPLLDSTFATASARVPAGGAMRLVLAGHAEAGNRIVLVLRPQIAAIDDAALPDVEVLPIGALTSRALTAERTRPDSIPGVMDDAPVVDEAGEAMPVLSSDAIVTIVAQAIGEGAHVEGAVRHLLVRGPAEARQRARGVVASLQERLLGNVVIRATAELEESTDTAAFAPSAPNGQRQQLHRIALPSLPGRCAAAFRGLETTAIRTMLPEIAQEASITVPVVETRQSGLWLQCRATAVGADEPLDLAVELRDHTTPQLRNLGTVGAIQLADTSSLRVRRRVALGTAAPTDLGTGTPLQFGGHSWRPVLHALRLVPTEVR